MRLRTAAAVLLVAATSAAAQFRYERHVTPGAAGANRLDVDAALLAGAAPDLHDLRFADGQGREVPYLLVQPAGTDPQWTPARTMPVMATKTTSGFEADLGGTREVDRLRIDGIAPPFMKHVTLEGSGDRSHWNLLADTTVFELPDQTLKQHDIAFIPGSYRYLRVTWDDRTSARARGEALVSARVHEPGASPEALRAPLAFRRGADPRVSRYSITLPAADLPVTALEVEIAAGDVFRNAAVSQPVLSGAEIVQVGIGSSKLRRASRDGLVASDLRIPVSRPSGRELLLTIDSTGSHPLPVTGIFAVYAPQPWIYFESPDGGPLTARYGDPATKAPQYDLEAARRFIDRAHPAAARWTTTPAAEAPMAMAVTSPIPSRGAKIDRSEFRYARPLPLVPAGLAIVPLDAHVIAHSREGAADVRVVDSQSRQIPYVPERRAEPLSIALKIPPRIEDKAASTYRFTMPYDTFRGEVALVLTTSAGVFERHVSVVAGADDRRGREPFEISHATWRNSDAETAPPALTQGPIPYGTSFVDVVIDEGDNAPLPITSARLLLPNWALRLQNPGEPLWLVYGNRTAPAPRYDLALIAPQLFTQPARELKPAAFSGKPDDREAAQLKYFWIVIAGAVVVLGALLTRLLTRVRSEESRPLGDAPGSGDSSR